MASSKRKPLRDSIHRFLSGPGHLEARRLGIHLRLNPHSAASVRDVCAAMAEGKSLAASSPSALLLAEADVTALRAHAAAIDRDLRERTDRKKDRSTTLTSRDAQHAELEKFYDWFAAAISMALPTGQGRREALMEVPRREARRSLGRSERA